MISSLALAWSLTTPAASCGPPPIKEVRAPLRFEPADASCTETIVDEIESLRITVVSGGVTDAPCVSIIESDSVAAINGELAAGGVRFEIPERGEVSIKATGSTTHGCVATPERTAMCGAVKATVMGDGAPITIPVWCTSPSPVSAEVASCLATPP